RRPGRDHHQASLGRAAAVRALWWRLPAVERPPGLRGPRPVPSPAGRDAGRRALSLSCARGFAPRRLVPCADPAVRHRPRMRDQPCAESGLCRRSRPCKRPRLRAYRNLLSYLRAAELPPAIGAAAGTATEGRPEPPRPLALRDRMTPDWGIA